MVDYLNQETKTNMFMDSISSIDDINFDQTISMFEDLNSLFFVFRNQHDKKNQTKRIFLHSNHKKQKEIKRHNKDIIKT